MNSAEEFAGQLHDAAHEVGALISMDGKDIGWAPEEAIPAMAELIAARDAEWGERVEQRVTQIENVWKSRNSELYRQVLMGRILEAEQHITKLEARIKELEAK
jgi:hypothetical protein